MLEKILPFLKDVIAQSGTKFLIAAWAIYNISEVTKTPELDFTRLLMGNIAVVIIAVAFYIFRYFTDKIKPSTKKENLP